MSESACTQVESVLESLRNGITKDIVSIASGITACQTVSVNLQKISGDFTQLVQQIRVIVERIADELKNRVDEDHEKLINNLTLVRQNAAARLALVFESPPLKIDNKNIHLYTATYRKTRTGAVYKLK